MNKSFQLFEIEDVGNSSQKAFDHVHFMLGAIYLVESVVITVSNILVLLVVTTTPSLRKPSNFLIVNLAFTDLFIGVGSLPPMVISNFIRRGFFLGRAFCSFHIVLDLICNWASVCCLCAMSIDRYLAISKPLQYRYIMTSKKIWMMIVIIWAISIGQAIPLVYDLWADETYCAKSGAYPIYVSLSTLVVFYLPMVIVIGLNIKIYNVVRTRRKTVMQGCKVTGTNGLRFNMKSTQNERNISDFGNYKHGTSGRFSVYIVNKTTKTGSTQRYEDKAAKTLAKIVGLFIFCFTPTVVLLTIGVICRQSCQYPSVALIASMILAYGNSMVNPFVYSFSNEEFKMSIGRVLRCECCK